MRRNVLISCSRPMLGLLMALSFAIRAARVEREVGPVSSSTTNVLRRVVAHIRARIHSGEMLCRR